MELESKLLVVRDAILPLEIELHYLSVDLVVFLKIGCRLAKTFCLAAHQQDIVSNAGEFLREGDAEPIGKRGAGYDRPSLSKALEVVDPSPKHISVEGSKGFEDEGCDDEEGAEACEGIKDGALCKAEGPDLVEGSPEEGGEAPPVWSETPVVEGVLFHY